MEGTDKKYWQEKLKNVIPADLVTPTIACVSIIHDEQLLLMAKKNKDYGNVIFEACDSMGDIYAYCRIFDKAKRFISLVKNHGKAEIKDDTLEDTIRDLANYCNMYLAWKHRFNEENKVSEPKNMQKVKAPVFVELYTTIRNSTVKLLEEETCNDVTDEIITNYGLSGLAKDNDGFVYNQNKDNSMVIVTTKNGRQVVAVRSSCVSDYKLKHQTIFEAK